MDETSAADDLPEKPPPDQPQPDPPTVDSPADPPRRSRSPRILRPWEALERLDRQWVDPTPIDQRERAVSLALTTPDDPRGWDYLGAMTGASAREIADACAAWLEAQLAADVTRLGRAYRPTVELLPLGRLWYVVRTVESLVVVIDGPGLPSPLAAASAAARRYGAELRRDLQRGANADVDVAPDEIPPASPEGDAGDPADESQSGASPDSAADPADDLGGEPHEPRSPTPTVS